MSSTLRPAGFSPLQAASQLSISRSHLYNLIAKGEIKVRKIGHRTVVPATEIDRLLAVDAPAE